MKLYRGIYRKDGTGFDPTHNHNEFWTDSLIHACNFAQCEAEGQTLPYCVIELKIDRRSLKKLPNFNFFHDKEVKEQLWYYDGKWEKIPDDTFNQEYTKLNNKHCCDFKFYTVDKPKWRTLNYKQIYQMWDKDRTDIAKFLKKQECMKRMFLKLLLKTKLMTNGIKLKRVEKPEWVKTFITKDNIKQLEVTEHFAIRWKERISEKFSIGELLKLNWKYKGTDLNDRKHFFRVKLDGNGLVIVTSAEDERNALVTIFPANSLAVKQMNKQMVKIKGQHDIKMEKKGGISLN